MTLCGYCIIREPVEAVEEGAQNERRNRKPGAMKILT